MLTRRRYAVVLELADGPLDVNEIARRLGCSSSYASRALGQLYDHGLVEIDVDRRQHVYELASSVRVERNSGDWHLQIRVEDGTRVTLAIPDDLMPG